MTGIEHDPDPGSANTVRAFAPGRVNLIGEHTDYNGGLALPFAIATGVTVTARRTAGGEIEAHALDLGETDRFAVRSADADAGGAGGDRPGHEGWRAFVRGASAELIAAGIPVPGARLEISGTVPRGAGLSSSAALSVALCTALIAISPAADGAEPRRPDPLALAQICQRVEQRWVGAQTGLLDQLASLLGRPGQAVLIDFRSLEAEPVPLALGEHRLVVLCTGETHAHAVSGYNRRRQECVEAARRMGKESLRDTQIQDLHLLPDVLAQRARHVISENARVEQAVSSLRTGDLDRLGRLLDASHASLRDDYEVSTPAVEAAVDALHRSGALGARLFGGGFGGSVLGLMPPDCRAPAGAIEVHPSTGATIR